MCASCCSSTGRDEELSFVVVGLVVNCVSLLTCVPIVLLNRAIVPEAHLSTVRPPRASRGGKRGDARPGDGCEGGLRRAAGKDGTGRG